MVKIQKLDDVIKMQLGASLDDINILFEAAYAGAPDELGRVSVDRLLLKTALEDLCHLRGVVIGKELGRQHGIDTRIEVKEAEEDTGKPGHMRPKDKVISFRRQRGIAVNEDEDDTTRH